LNNINRQAHEAESFLRSLSVAQLVK